MHSDAQEFGPIVDRLVGSECERSLATNSLKFRFDTRHDPHGRKYIWIDPPWQFLSPEGLITSSTAYDGEGFEEWSDLFDPLNSTVLLEWRIEDDGCVIFQFANGFQIIVPWTGGDRQKDDWYSHWYACDKTSSSQTQ